jgi:hypothetical protein
VKKVYFKMKRDLGRKIRELSHWEGTSLLENIIDGKAAANLSPSAEIRVTSPTHQAYQKARSADHMDDNCYE